MKRILITFVLWICFTTTATATEILMFSMKSCGYCRSFLKEVAQEYNNTEHAKLLPLRIISMDRKNAPKWFQKAYDEERLDGITGTPTFVVWDGEERARLIGYQGKERFYDDISRFIANNKKQLEARVGKDRIPFEKDTEMLPVQALAESMGETPKQESNLNKNGMPKFPNGVFKSRDIMDHQYKTETEAQTAANFLGCLGTHTHLIKGEKIFMPCEMN